MQFSHDRLAAMAVPPALRALLAQLLATVAALAWAAPLHAAALDWLLLQSALAAALSYGLGLAPWWLPMQLAFLPAVWLAASFELPAHWFLGGFLLLVLVYRGVYRSQVPLYLSSRAARHALTNLLPQDRRFAFVDLGCGLGSMLGGLARVRGDGCYVGVEAAPLPYLWSWLRAKLSRGDCRVLWGDLWRHELAPYDVVYAYLSPVPMAALWQKARREMRPGSLFVSNTFAVPGVVPDFSVGLDDGSDGMLHVWRM